MPRRSKRSENVVYSIVVKQLNDSIPNELIDKLFSTVRYDVNDKGCWIRGNDSTIYTTIKYNGKPVRAHRFSFLLFNGKPLDKFGCHSCDVPACINPDHILDRSNKWNHEDAVAKGLLGQAWLGRKDKIPEKIGIDYYRETKPDFVERLL